MTVLVINGHPGSESLTRSLATAYAAGARASGVKVEILHLGELEFDPVLHEGYRTVMPLEPDLERAQALIRSADHLAFFFPQWWGSAPALLKGFIDRVFLPGFAFRSHTNDPWWDKLLTGRSAEIWLLSDAPRMWTMMIYRDSPIHWLKNATLEYCGIKPVRVRHVTQVRSLSADQRTEQIRQAEKRGSQLLKR